MYLFISISWLFLTNFEISGTKITLNGKTSIWIILHNERTIPIEAADSRFELIKIGMVKISAINKPEGIRLIPYFKKILFILVFFGLELWIILLK